MRLLVFKPVTNQSMTGLLSQACFPASKGSQKRASSPEQTAAVLSPQGHESGDGLPRGQGRLPRDVQQSRVQGRLSADRGRVVKPVKTRQRTRSGGRLVRADHRGGPRSVQGPCPEVLPEPGG